MDKDILIVIISTSIPAIISIIGFISTYKATKRHFIEELNNSKKTQNIEKLQNVIHSIITIMNDINNINLDAWKEIISNIISYGSTDSIKIITYLQTNLYKNNLDPMPKKESNIFILTTFSLLITQIKYDLTGEIMPSLTYLKVKLTDFEKMENEYYIKNNEIIDELGLNPNFKTI